MEMTRQQAEKIATKAIENPSFSWVKEIHGKRKLYRSLNKDFWIVSYHEPLEGWTTIDLGFGEKKTIPSQEDLVGISLVDTDSVTLGNYEERGEFGLPRHGTIIVSDIQRYLGPATRLYKHLLTLEERTSEKSRIESDKKMKKRLEEAIKSL